MALVTSLRDGMNLVSYEFVACQDEKKGVLILSEVANQSKFFHENIIMRHFYSYILNQKNWKWFVCGVGNQTSPRSIFFPVIYSVCVLILSFFRTSISSVEKQKLCCIIWRKRLRLYTLQETSSCKNMEKKNTIYITWNGDGNSGDLMLRYISHLIWWREWPLPILESKITDNIL